MFLENGPSAPAQGKPLRLKAKLEERKTRGWRAGFSLQSWAHRGVLKWRCF